MSGLLEVECGACAKRHVVSAAQARSQRVLRCECGQFVRLDRALTEARSDPAPPAPAAPRDELDDDLDDEETHMFSSLEAIAALRSPRAPAAVMGRASVYDEDDAAATRAASSAVPLSRSSAPPPRASSPVRRPSSPAQSAVTPKADKPLWYVDLGGAETVEMTIEQLILARRSGKLGEGALVWRAGMPEWRSVGSLIPAASNGALRTLPPAAPVRAKQPTLAPLAEPSNAPLGSYERPLATLEFALEPSEPAGVPKALAPSKTPPPRGAAQTAPSKTPPPRSAAQAAPSKAAPARGAAQAAPLRAATPVPRAPSLSRPGTSQVGPLPAPAPLPSAPRRAAPTPLPPVPELARASEPTPAPARAMVMPLLQRLSPTTPSPPTTAPSSPFNFYSLRGPRPPWLSVAIAVVLCIAASGSGAFLVRTLKLHRQPLSLTPTPVATPATPAVPVRSVQSAPEAPAPSTEIVDVDSLSVERRTPRALARPSPPAGPTVQPPAVSAGSSVNAEENGSSPPAPAKKSKTSDLPAAAHANPYTTGELSDSTPKKPATGSGDEPGF